MIKYVILDLETTISNLFDRSPNPYFQRILAIGSISSDASGQAKVFETFTVPSTEYILVGHNIKYDLLHLWKNKDFQDWLKQGGEIWDTQLAEYMISGQTNKFPGLREIAVAKYGCKARTKYIDELLEEGQRMEEMPIELLHADVKNDVLDTEQVFLKQLKQLTKRQFNLYSHQMKALLATTEIEFNGLYVNKSVLNTNKYTLSTKIGAVEKKISEFVSPYWDRTDEVFMPTSTAHLRLVFYGGTFKVPRIQQEGFFKNGKERFRKVIDECHLKGMELEPIAKTPSGLAATDEKTLQTIALNKDSAEGQFAKLLLEFRECKKALSTYYESMEAKIYPDGCVHAQISHCGYGDDNERLGGGTDTGRLSATNPNIQNQPRPPSLVRDHFTSRYGSAGIVVDVDFSQIEVVVFAYLSKDKNLCKLLQEGKDIHRYLAAKMYSKKEDEITKEERQSVKPCTFLTIYGGGAWQLSQVTGLDQSFCEAFIASFFEAFPEAKSWHTMLLKEVAKTGKILLPTGRLLCFKKFSAKYDWQREQGITEAYNPSQIKDWPVQALATADIVLIGLGKMFDACIHHRDKFLLVNTVHDDYLFDCKKEHLNLLQNLINDSLSAIIQTMRDDFHMDINVPIKWEIKTGDSWYDCK